MRKLVPLLSLLAGCASLGGSPGAPLAHPHLCGTCSGPCPNQDRVCEPEGEAKVAQAAPAPAPAPREPAAATAFEPVSGTYAPPQMASLSTSTPDAVIHYTTDGSTPTDESPIYSGPILVDTTTTIQAIALAPGMPPSPVSSASYTIAPPPPPAPPARVVFTQKKLELTEKVFFDTGKVTVKPTSFSLLDEVASVVKDHAEEVKRIRIEGHTDNVGNAATNNKLSAGRAEAVRAYLVQKGVTPERLEAAGFGASRPVADNSTASGREENRRVEFVVVSQ